MLRFFILVKIIDYYKRR